VVKEEKNLSMKKSIDERISSLRALMRQHQIDAYLIPSNDPHQSEYVAERWKAREWISGFTGSAGIAIVTADHAGLWTDSRYFLQAEEQLKGSRFVLHKLKIPHAPEHLMWLAENLPEGAIVGADGNLFSPGQVRSIRKHLHKKNIEFDQVDLIGEIWKDRPGIPVNPLFEFPLEFAGQSRREKLDRVLEKMAGQGASLYLVSTLDDIAWCLNIRSNDVEFNPVCICYLVIGRDTSYLFIDEEKVPSGISGSLHKDGIEIRPYEEIEDFLARMSESRRILVDTHSISIRLYEGINEDQRIDGENLILPMKAVKNEVEIGHIRSVMRRDGVALLRLYRWLEEKLNAGKVTELEVAEQLARFRGEQGNYYGESFAAIVGYNSNGAIVHYKPQAETCASIHREGILLLDSGGQYLDGTTDITRTTALGPPTSEQKRNYTLVLKGHIALATIQFPEGTMGAQLDTLARIPLWKEGLNYGHGTGHGVGFFLSVHEPPQGFAASAVTSRGTTPLAPGTLTSNEPGFYKDGEYGIRIENLVLCVEAGETPYGKFLKFETVSLFPIDTSLVELALLTKEEKDWLNDYHRQVFVQLSPLLNEDEKKWLEEKCGQ
jgi:Xaa-Pro aminopeptidase